MGHEMQDIIPASGMDTDSDDRKIEPGSYRYALNFRNGTGYIGREGAGTNTKGNVDIPTYFCPYNGGTFPEGKNKTIGSFEDTIHNTVIFLNWNSKGKHGIYRWYPNKSDANNPNGVVEQIIQYDFKWKQKERITSINYVSSSSGDLLYWIDNTGLRKINIDKANINGKPKSWNIYFPKTNAFTVNGQFLIISIKDYNGNYLSGMPFQIPLQKHENTNDGIAFIAQYINNPINWNITPSIVAEACSCHLKITEIGTSAFTYEVSSSFINPIPSIIVPDNWYGSGIDALGSSTKLTDRMFDRVPYPPLNAPLAEYRKDPQTLFNNVRNRVFQFCLEYGYYDFEKTVLGVYSQIPINNLQCDGTVNEAYNYIHINFNDDQLPLAETLTILKDVAVLAKEGNKATFREVLRVEPCDFLDYDYTTNKWFCFYDFYNNIISTVTTNNPERLESGVPIMANAEIYNKDRFVEGGVVLGRDNVDCAEADYKIQIESTPQPKLHKITGLIRVFNPFMDNTNQIPNQFQEPNVLERRSGILYDSTLAASDTDVVYPFFGATFYESGSIQLKSDWAYKYKQQILPEGGWPVYAAGTKFFTISKQVQRQNVNQRSDGAIDVSNFANQQSLKTLLSGFNANTTPPYNPNNDLYSTFEMLVPDGEYIIRLASHWCSYNDKLGRGEMYDLNNQITFQQTSTYVWGVNDFGIGGGYKNDYEIKVTVSGSDVFIGEFLVADTALPSKPFDGRTDILVSSISGYVLDAFGLVGIDEVSTGVRVEKAYVLYRDTDGGGNTNITNLRKYNQRITDHNGFFFIGAILSTSQVKSLGVWQVGGVAHAQEAINYIMQPDPLATDYSGTQSALKLLQLKTIQVANIAPTNNILFAEFIVPTTNTQIRLNSSTFITGLIVDANNLPVSQATVLYQHGRFVESTTNGYFTILAWGDMRTCDFNNPLVNNHNRILDSLIYNGQVFCNPTYPNGQQLLVRITQFGLNTSTVPPPYSPTAVYNVGNFVIIENNNPTQKARKRGGTYIDVARYYDEQGRYCSCEKLYEMYIPFETEDLGKFPQVVDSNGNPYPLGTYIGGKPVIRWQLNYNPPEYAAYYQIMRTKNLYYGRYLQWVVDGVTYLSAVRTEATPEIETSYLNKNAVAIKLSLNNIISYSANNPGSLVSYTYNAGDRVRIMYDRNLNLIQGLQDFEITSFDAQTQSIVVKNFTNSYEIKSGFVIEIYNPKSVDSEDTQVFYEVGEVYKCTAPNTPNNQHSVTSGVFTNGDTYWHGRNILVNDDRDNFGANYPVVIESASVSDFFSSESQDIGRLGLIDPNLKQIYYPSRLIVSDQFQQDSAFNGLSSFSALNTKDEGRQYGEVSRLVMIGKILHAIMKGNNISNYVGVVTFRYAQSTQGVQAIADDYLGTQEPSLSNLGTQHPGSVVQYDGYIYGISDLRKSVWRHATDGMTEISRNTFVDALGVARTRMVNYFKNICENGLWDATATYDKRYKEYILTTWKNETSSGVKFSSIQTQVIDRNNKPQLIQIVRFNSLLPIEDGDVIIVTYTNSETGQKVSHEVTVTNIETSPDTPSAPARTDIYFASPEGDIKKGASVLIKYRGKGQTIAWNEEKNRWTTEYSFLPEAYSPIGDELVSFKEGRLWLHDKNAIRNNFYNSQYSLKVSPVFNQEPLFTKVWNALWMLMFQDNKKNNWFSNLITNQAKQLSRLKAANFIKREEGWYSEFKRDLTDTSVSSPITEGRVLRSSALEINMENDHTGEVVLMGWRVNYTISERTKK